MEKYIKWGYQLLSKYYVNIVLLVSFLATAGSLYFSEIAHIPPCNMCWYQRIFMYPIFVISLVALLKKDKAVSKYIVVLSTIGLVLATYHVLLQYTHLVPSVGCSIDVSCSSKDLDLFGFINIPLLSWLAFAFITGISILDFLKSLYIKVRK